MKLPRVKFFENLKIKETILPYLKEERTQKFTTLILTLVTLSFFIIIAINPTISTIISLNKQLDDAKLVDMKMSQKINNLTVLQAEYENLQGDIPAILTAVPKSPEVPLFAAQLQATSADSRISLVSFQTFEVGLQSKSPGKKYFSYNFALVAEGNYNDLESFLNNLSNMQRVVAIDSLSLTKKTGEGNTLQLTLKGKTIFSE